MKRLLILLIMLGMATSPALAQFGGSPFSAGNAVLSGDITMQNGELISNTTDGIICLKGAGGTNNEDICFDLETGSANVVRLFSNTGARFQIDTTLQMLDGHLITLGTSVNDPGFTWETQGNDNWQEGITVGASTGSGYKSLMEKADMGNANRSPSGTSPDPVLRVYSSDATQANDYIEMFHNQSNGLVKAPGGELHMTTSNSNYIFGQTDTFYQSGLYQFKADQTNDEFKIPIDDSVGNQLVIGNYDNRNSDNDHPTTTDPTLFIQSDTDPDVVNTQFGQLFHDKTDFVIQGGSSGHISMEDDTGLIVQIRREIGATNSQFILVSPDGSCSACSVNNSDAFACASATCP